MTDKNIPFIKGCDSNVEVIFQS